MLIDTKEAKTHYDTLMSLIDGEEDELSEILSPIAELLKRVVDSQNCGSPDEKVSEHSEKEVNLLLY